MTAHTDATGAGPADRLLFWAPRVTGIMATLFVALFALDAFTGRSFREGLPAFLIHLVPAALVAALVAVAWRYERIGAAAFFVLALVYALTVRWRLDWIAAISGPLVLIGMLFLVSWVSRRAVSPAR